MDKATFEEVEDLNDGLGPLYNAQSCRECHQSPVSGAASQVTELRAGQQRTGRAIPQSGHPDQLAERPSSRGESLVNDRAICPNAAFPSEEIQERVPPTETVRVLRLSRESIGRRLRRGGRRSNVDQCGEAAVHLDERQDLRAGVAASVIEAPGQMGVGRFGWKDRAPAYCRSSPTRT